jgi:hypothetical protein
VRLPYNNVEDPDTLTISQDMIRIVLQMKYREPFSAAIEEEFPEIVNMIRLMWSGDPSKRPKIKKVLAMLYEFEDHAFNELSERKKFPVRLVFSFFFINSFSSFPFFINSFLLILFIYSFST